ncbi:MAG: hypothetical protein L6R39_002646 [Caloplaca ligustica]|nr:MAG: hypothetical protein L6R39_002646 [Caloplaca ligustica]
MNDIRFQSFADPWTGIGTYGLRACSVALVASKAGAILAHIAPLGEVYAKNMMDAFATIYQQHKSSHFGSDQHPWLIIGILQQPDHDEDPLEHMTETIRAQLSAMGLGNHSDAVYKFKRRRAADSPPFPGKGTVFVDGAGSQLKIYVEDQLVHSS